MATDCSALEDIVIEPQGCPDDKNINHRLPSGETLLTALIHTENLDLIKHAITKGADVSKPNNVGVTPLAAAVRTGNDDVVRILLESGARVNQASRFGFSPLQIALTHHRGSIVDMLLKHGANANGIADNGLHNPWSTDALALAVLLDTTDVLQALLSHGAVIKKKAVITEALHCDSDAPLAMLLDHLSGDLTQFPDSCSFLSLAAQRHDCSKVKLLLKYGAKTHFDDDTQLRGRGYSAGSMIELHKGDIPPLAACIHYDCRTCVDLILSEVSEKGGVNCVFEFGLSPLCYTLMDDPWRCDKAASGRDHRAHKCNFRVGRDMANNILISRFPVCPTRLYYAREFLVRGADINYIFKTHSWSVNEKTHLPPNETALHVCLRAYQPNLLMDSLEGPEAHEHIRISQMFRSVGLALDFHALLLVYLLGYRPSHGEMGVLSSKAMTNRALSDEAKEHIAKFSEKLLATPRRLQNAAVIAIRHSLAGSGSGKTGNILFAAEKLEIPTVLRNQITLGTYDGLVDDELVQQVCNIHRKQSV